MKVSSFSPGTEYPWANSWKIVHALAHPLGSLYQVFDTVEYGLVYNPRHLPGWAFHNQLPGICCPWPKPDWWGIRMMMEGPRDGSSLSHKVPAQADQNAVCSAIKENHG